VVARAKLLLGPGGLASRSTPVDPGRARAALGGAAARISAARTLERPLLILAAIACVSSLGVAIVGPLNPVYARTLGATPLQLGLLTSVFAVASSLAQILTGLSIDRLGARRFLRAGTALYAAANALTATATGVTAVLGWRAAAGLGSGANLVATRVYVAQRGDPARLALVNGLITAAGSVGLVLGPLIGAVVAELSDVRVPYLVVGLLGAGAFAGALGLRSPGPTTAPAPAPSGTAERPFGFVSRATGLLLAVQLCLSAGVGSFMTALAPLVTELWRWPTYEVGALYAVYGAGSVALGPWLAGLADRVGRARIASLGCLAWALVSLAFAVGAPRPLIYLSALALGAAATGFTAAWFAMLSAAAPAAHQGRAIGLVSALGNLGTVAGALLGAAAWQAVGISAAMTLAAAVSLAGAALLSRLAGPSASSAGRSARSDAR
jgi:DHA1 family tetracycline resistance protein-like MFS transporter